MTVAGLGGSDRTVGALMRELELTESLADTLWQLGPDGAAAVPA